MKKLFILSLALMAAMASWAYVCDFEDATANTAWQFIQDGQTNYWTIGTDAGSMDGSANALYITSGSGYGYDNEVPSVSWACIPVTLLTDAGLSFDWICIGESNYDYLSVYLFPEGSLPTAGSEEVPTDAICLNSRLNQSDYWETYVHGNAAVGNYNLCFMWRNDGSQGSYPAVIDNVVVENKISLTKDNILYELFYVEGVASVVGYTADLTGSISIPASITHEGETYAVTIIADNVFQSNTAITSVSLPNSVTSIGASAFDGCTALTSVNIPQGVTAIKNYTFRNCNKLASIALPNTIISIGSSAFYSCDALTSIYLPSALTSIGSSAFRGCGGLTAITIPDGVTTIPSEAFESCDKLASVVLGNQVTSINYEAFNYCSALTSVTLPCTVTSINSYAFSSTPSNLVFSLAASSVEEYCNSNINQLLYSYYSSNARKLLINGEELTEVVVPNTVTTIPSYAFYNCTNISSVTLPTSITHIGDYAFANLPYCMIHCATETPATIGSFAANGDQFFVVPDVDAYKTAWPNYKNHIVSQDYQQEITVSALSDKSTIHQALSLDVLGNLVALKVNGTINSYDIMMLRNQMPHLRELDLSDASIVANAYEYTNGYCSKADTLTSQSFTGTGTKIRKLILPRTLKSIEANAINNELRDLTILSGEIQPSAFKDRTGLAKVVIDNATTSLANYVFKSCTSLVNVQLPATLRTIGVDAFHGCSALQAISLPDSLETIGNYAFQGAGLTSITIPANVSSLGVGAFAGRSSSSSSSSSYGYYSSETSTSKDSYYTSDPHSDSYYYNNYYSLYNGKLREVTIPADSKLTTIPSRAFEGNEALSKLSILGDSITIIEDVAFRRCQLDTLILPPNLKSISTLSFGYCTGLKYVAMPNSLTEVPANAFVGCTSLNDVQFPTKLTHIGHHAFADCTGLSNVDIPGLVTSIGDYAFKGCNVNQVHSYLFDPFTIGQNTFSAYANANAILYIPNVEDTEMKYLYDTQWSQFLNRVRMDDSFTYDDFYANGDIVITPDDDPLNGDPNANLNPGSGLVVGDGDTQQNMGTITLNGEIGDWASILAGCNLNVDTLILNFTIAGKKWHFFGFPFELKISDIISDGKFVVYEYDGQIRAERDTTGWKKISDKQTLLYPGVGYIFQFNFEVEGTFSIKVSAPQFCQLVELIELAIHPSSKPNNVNWNYIANPLLAYYDILDLGFDGPITLWDVLSGTYRSIRPGDDEYYLSPYEAFFLQNLGENPLEVIFNREKGMTKKQMNEKKNQQHAPARRTDAESTRAFVNLTLSNGELADDTRVVFNEQQTLGYDMGWDAAKFFSTERVPQLYSYDAENTYAINERPIDNGTVKLGVQLPSAGTYSIGVSRMDTALYLWDKQEDYYHDLSTGDYYFTGKSGDNSDRFELVTRQQASTAVENIGNQDVFTLTKDGIILHEDAELQVYNTAGQTLVEGTQTGNIALPAGVYMLVINGQTYKHIIR